MYSLTSNFAVNVVNVLEDDSVNVKSANLILFVKLGSQAVLG